MCGIAGWIEWDKDLRREEAVLQGMGRTLARRGPDAGGTWFGPSAALAHRRLVVIDPEGGAQPMRRRSGERNCVLVYNGELYNAAELRRELESLGHFFRTRSDTEVLLFSYIAWGTACPEHLNGIFAFAVWDEGAESLFLARDRLGIKPLFFTRRGNALLFGSELKALLSHPAVPAELDAQGLAEVFAVGPARTPGHGVFRGIEEVLPGEWVRYDRGGLRRGRYWRLESRPHLDDLPTTAAKVRELLEDAVERQLVSDVPLVTLLSGGLDSSAVTAFAAAAGRRAGGDPTRTFAVDFAGRERDFQPNAFQPELDGPWAERVAAFLGTRHRSISLENDAVVEGLGAALRFRDLPGMADVDTSLYLFFRELKKEATVALSGEGADEIFGGYPWCHREEPLRADTFPWSLRLPDRVALLAPDLAARIRPEDYVRERYREALSEVPRLGGENPDAARRREILYLNITRFLPTLLDRKDRMSMGVGFEVRVPFLDHRLVEYVWNIPWDMKNHGGAAKGILRLALAGLLPDDCLNRRKMPYPSTHDPAYSEAFRQRLLGVLNDPASPLVPLLDVAAVREVAATERTPEGFKPWFSQLMGRPQLFAYLVQLDWWLREYKVSIC